MFFNYNPFADMEEREDLYYRASLAGFENLDDFYSYMKKFTKNYTKESFLFPKFGNQEKSVS